MTGTNVIFHQIKRLSMKAQKQHQKIAARTIQSRANTNITFADNRQQNHIHGVSHKTIQLVGGYIPGNPAGPYAALGNNFSSPGTNFSAAQKNAILNANFGNAQQINVTYQDDHNGNPLGDYTQVAAIDHIYPKGLGGINAYANAQVIDAHTNSGIGNAYPKHGYNGARLYVGHTWNRIINGLPCNYPVGSILNINGQGAAATIATYFGNISLAVARQIGLLGTVHDPV